MSWMSNWLLKSRMFKPSPSPVFLISVMTTLFSFAQDPNHSTRSWFLFLSWTLCSSPVNRINPSFTVGFASNLSAATLVGAAIIYRPDYCGRPLPGTLVPIVPPVQCVPSIALWVKSLSYHVPPLLQTLRGHPVVHTVRAPTCLHSREGHDLQPARIGFGWLWVVKE